MVEKPDMKKIKENFLNKLELQFNVEPSQASDKQIYQALSAIIVEELKKKRQKFINKVHSDGKKQVYYLSMEFLMGRSLKTSLYNLEIVKDVEKMLKEYDIRLDDIYEYDLMPDSAMAVWDALRHAILTHLLHRHFLLWDILSATNTVFSSKNSKTAGKQNFLITGCPAVQYGLMHVRKWQLTFTLKASFMNIGTISIITYHM